MTAEQYPEHGPPLFALRPWAQGPVWLHWPHTHAVSPGISKCNPPSNSYCSDLPEPCSYEGRVFQDGEDWPLSQCAKCVCRNGVAQCFAAQCHPLFCNQVRKTASERILHRLLTSLFRNLESLLRFCQADLGSTENKKQRRFYFPYTFRDHPWEISFTLRCYR